MIFLLILICHVQGCMLFLSVEADKLWIPPLDFGTLSTDTFDEEKGFVYQYFKMLYHSVLVYAMSDISVRTSKELLLVASLIIVSAIVNAIIYGQFAVLTDELNRDTNVLIDRLNLVNSVMAKENIPMELKTDVRVHILTTHRLKREQQELNEFEKTISSSMRRLVRENIFMRTFSGSGIARYLKSLLYMEEMNMHMLNITLLTRGLQMISVPSGSKQFEKIVFKLSTEADIATKLPDTKILSQGFRETDFMYLISEGTCHVTTLDRNLESNHLEEIFVRRLEVSDYFGEISLVYDGVRTANVISMNYVTLNKISGKLLYEICGEYQSFRKVLMQRIHVYDDNTRLFLIETLRTIPYLAECREETISALAHSMKYDFLENGAIYSNVGDTAKCMTIILDGTIEINLELDQGTPVILERLKRGAVVNAYAMLIED